MHFLPIKRAAGLLIAAASTLGFAGLAQAQGAVITYGNTSLGVNASGELNFFGSGPGGDLVYGVYRAGVGDAISPGCPCEGWGVSLNNGANTFATFANQSLGSGGFGGGNTFGSTAVTATSAVNMFDLPVSIRHAYGPSVAPDVFQVQVTIINNGSGALGDLTYRRAMDWDVPPTLFNEYVTHQGVVANLVANGGNLKFAGNNGFASSDPRSDWTDGWWGASDWMRPTYADQSTLIDTRNTDFNKAGPYDHGSVFDFSFGSLAAGQSRIFNIFYGSAPNEASALSKLNALGVSLYSLGQSSPGFSDSGCGGEPCGDPGLSATAVSATPATGDNPANYPTFIFAFGGVGGVEPGTSPSAPILPFVPAPGQFTFDAPTPRRWFDPPFATGFTITVDGGDMISIEAPPGFSGLSIEIGGIVVATGFGTGPGDTPTYTFGSGVSSFKITGFSIDTATTDLSTAFPLWMDFAPSVTGMTWVADITAVPEPSSYAMLLSGLAVLGWAARRRRATRA